MTPIAASRQTDATTPVQSAAEAPARHSATGLALELIGIRKSFDGFLALDDGRIAVRRGEIHGLLGENGAGKSSLMNVAAGLYAPDAGRIMIDGREFQFKNPREARAQGIGMVHQHFKLVRPFTVAENIFLADRRAGFDLGLAAIEAAIRTHADALEFEIDPRRPVASLSFAEQQRVEIVKALVAGARILILDEPTAVLTDQEAERLLTNISRLAQHGAAIVLVTHRLGDVMSFADRVTIMRGGRTEATVDPKTTTARELTSLAVGSAQTPARRGGAHPREDRLVVSGLSCARDDGHVALHDTSFVVRAGEIFGIAGVGGNGQTELAEALTGMGHPLGGAVELMRTGDTHFDDVTGASPRRLRAAGLAVIPADRAALALASALSVAENYGVERLRAGLYGSWLWVARRRMRRDAEAAVREFDILGVRGQNQKAALLSGGNAQKLVLAREFGKNVTVIVAHSPSRGLDVRACADVHARLLKARDDGVAVLLISEDLDEVLTLSDRIGVMTRGRIAAQFEAPFDRQEVGRAMVDHA